MATYSLSIQISGSYLQNTFYLANLSSAYNVGNVAVNGNNIIFANNANSFQGQQIIYSTNGGSTWLLNSRNPFPNNPNSFNSVSLSDNGYIFVCGNQGAFLSTDLGLSYYSIQNPPWGNYGNGVIGTITSTGYTLAIADIGTSGNFNRIWLSTNNGLNWSQVFGNNNFVHDNYFNGNGSTGINMLNSGLLISKDGRIIVVANTIAVAVSLNAGYNWTLFGATGNTSVLNQNIRSIAMTDDGRRIVVSTINSGVYLSTDYGATCNRILNRNTGAIAISGNGSVILVNDWNNGSINNSTNGGVTWNNQFYTNGSHTQCKRP
jgi:photosystem II stability/assembly factor-like uncharacterized protein